MNVWIYMFFIPLFSYFMILGTKKSMEIKSLRLTITVFVLFVACTVAIFVLAYGSEGFYYPSIIYLYVSFKIALVLAYTDFIDHMKEKISATTYGLFCSLITMNIISFSILSYTAPHEAIIFSYSRIVFILRMIFVVSLALVDWLFLSGYFQHARNEDQRMIKGGYIRYLSPLIFVLFAELIVAAIGYIFLIPMSILLVTYIILGLILMPSLRLSYILLSPNTSNSPNIYGFLITDGGGIPLYKWGFGEVSDSNTMLMGGAIWSIIKLMEKTMNKELKSIQLNDCVVVIEKGENIYVILFLDRVTDTIHTLVRAIAEKVDRFIIDEKVMAGLVDMSIVKKISHELDKMLLPIMEQKKGVIRSINGSSILF